MWTVRRQPDEGGGEVNRRVRSLSVGNGGGHGDASARDCDESSGGGGVNSFESVESPSALSTGSVVAACLAIIGVDGGITI